MCRQRVERQEVLDRTLIAICQRLGIGFDKSSRLLMRRSVSLLGPFPV
jgi:hypothetical protein